MLVNRPISQWPPVTNKTVSTRDPISDQRAAVRAVGTDGRCAHALEVDAQDAADATQRLRTVAGLFQDLAGVDGLAELHHGRATVDQGREETTDAAGDAPVLGEENLEDALLLVRRAADQDRNRHDLNARQVVFLRALEQLSEHFRMPSPLGTTDDEPAVAA